MPAQKYLYTICDAKNNNLCLKHRDDNLIMIADNTTTNPSIFRIQSITGSTGSTGSTG